MIVAFAALLCAGAARAQQPDVSAKELVRRAANNEIAASNHGGEHFMYKDSTTYRDHSLVREVIETNAGNLSRTIGKNGKPLTPEEQARTDEKLKHFANDPEARRKKQQADKEDDQRAATLMRALPDAFLYTYAGTGQGPNGSEVIKLKFKPNPGWTPPNRETQVFEGMQGDMSIDKKAQRVAEINGVLFKDVNFGWGILGKLDKGGKFIIKQADVGNGHWEMIEETLQFNGKVLMFKPLTIWSTETMTDFRPVPPKVTTAQALELLQKSTEVIAENGGGVKEQHK